jgi:hypothetical protein
MWIHLSPNTKQSFGAGALEAHHNQVRAASNCDSSFSSIKMLRLRLSNTGSGSTKLKKVLFKEKNFFFVEKLCFLEKMLG